MVHDQLVICDYIRISILQTGYAAPLSVTWGQEVNQTITCIPWGSCGLLHSGKSPTVAMVLLYHMRDKDDKKPGGVHSSGG